MGKWVLPKSKKQEKASVSPAALITRNYLRVLCKLLLSHSLKAFLNSLLGFCQDVLCLVHQHYCVARYCSDLKQNKNNFFFRKKEKKLFSLTFLKLKKVKLHIPHELDQHFTTLSRHNKLTLTECTVFVKNTALISHCSTLTTWMTNSQNLGSDSRFWSLHYIYLPYCAVHHESH